MADYPSVLIQIAPNTEGINELAQRFKGAKKKKILEKLLEIRRNYIRQEFEGGFGYNRAGGMVKWDKAKPFGDWEPREPMRWKGELFGSYLGIGKYAIQPKYTDDSVTFGSSAPYARMFRGSDGSVKNVKIAVTAKMRRWVAFKYGVYFSKNKQFITVKQRPHAFTNPKVIEEMKQAIFAAMQ